MSVEDHILIDAPEGPAPIVFAEPDRKRRSFRPRLRRRDRPPKPRVRKLRLLLVLIAFLGLAGTSALFGMLTAIASDLHYLVPTVPSTSVDSYLYDDTGQPIGVLAPPTKAVLDTWNEISPNMIHAIVAVEDKRFWSDPGIDVRGLIRAAVSDITGGPREGGSTIAEEFVKIKEAQLDNRTIFEKLREAALAFQLVQRWPRWKILTAYLNTIYFGNGANGIEAAARVYFGKQLGYNALDPGQAGCGDPDASDTHRRECADLLSPAQAALLAGMVANPYQFDPLLHPRAAEQRRDLVLQDMYQQHYINRHQYEQGLSTPLPTSSDIQQPQEPAAAPYFTTWVRPLIINALKQEGVKDPDYEAYYGNLKIRLTINLQLQEAAQRAVNEVLPHDGLSASLVAIDNRTGQVRAMVSGDGEYSQAPFNLATLGYRQPGSSFKLFTLAAALSSGRYGPDSVIDSKPIKIPFTTPNGYQAKFDVHNFGNEYNGPETLATATAISDNSVFAQVGTSVRSTIPASLSDIAGFATAMGIRSPISQTPAMILGGLNTGVSALDLAHAYQTVANGGVKDYDDILGDYQRGPIGIASITGCKECRTENILASKTLQTKRVLSAQVASTIAELLHGPVDDPYGTGTAAAIPGVDVAGKTGTTSNYVDAWFVGWTPQLTVAVWVGYPNSGKPMLTNYYGKPVEGGTFPAIIWHNFTVTALQDLANEAAAEQHKTATSLGLQTTPVGTTTTSSTTNTSGTTTGTVSGTGGTPGSTQLGTSSKKNSTPAGTQPTQNNGANATQNVTNSSTTQSSSNSGGGITNPAPTSTTQSTTPTGASGGNGL